MLTAEEARNLAPRVDIDPVRAAIENAIRSAARSGKTQVEVTGLIPGWEGWVIGRKDTGLDQLKADLIEAGFEVDAYAGGHGGRGYVRIGWVA